MKNKDMLSDMSKVRTNIFKEAKDLILSFDDWLFYFIEPKKVSPIEDFISENPDWKDKVSLTILSMDNSGHVNVEITLDYDSTDYSKFRGKLYLYDIERTIKINKAYYDGELKNYRINILKDKIKFLESDLRGAIKELEKLTDYKPDEDSCYTIDELISKLERYKTEFGGNTIVSGGNDEPLIFYYDFYTKRFRIKNRAYDIG